MPLINVNLPTPKQLRGRWATRAALQATKGIFDATYATDKEWHFHDGGGNWACLRFLSMDKAVMFGHDHEYSEARFQQAATDFGEEETNLLDDAPSWWGEIIDPLPEHGFYVGFIYGWDGKKWWRANYDKQDGFKQVGLLEAISIFGRNSLTDYAVDLPERPGLQNIWRGLKSIIYSAFKIRALIAADGNISETMLNGIIQGDSKAGVEAAKSFLKMKLD